MSKRQVQPESKFHELTSYCETCQEKLVITELVANSKGQLEFILTCFRCGNKFGVATDTEHIKAHCFDMDFLELAKIKK